MKDSEPWIALITELHMDYTSPIFPSLLTSLLLMFHFPCAWCCHFCPSPYCPRPFLPRPLLPKPTLAKWFLPKWPHCPSVIFAQVVFLSKWYYFGLTYVLTLNYFTFSINFDRFIQIWYILLLFLRYFIPISIYLGNNTWKEHLGNKVTWAIKTLGQ